MKSSFPGYYRASAAELEGMWESATFILDTNALLNLYRYTAKARDEFLNVLSSLSPRIWIPYQVGLEFQRRRLAVIAGEKASLENALNSVESSSRALQALFASGTRNPYPTSAIKKALEAISLENEKIKQELQMQKDALSDVHHEDKIREKLDSIVGVNIGPPPDAVWLNEASQEGVRRYADSVPPGGKDAQKSETFVDRGLNYEAKFGDYYLWRQILDHVKANSVESVVFVTDDRKEDWWQIISGKTIGHRPELADEICNFSGVSRFHMYQSDQFLKYAQERGQQGVTAEIVEHVRQTNLEAIEDQNNDEALIDIISPRDFLIHSDAALRTHLVSEHYTESVEEKPFGNCKFLVDTVLEEVCVYRVLFANWTEKSLKLALLRAHEGFREAKLVRPKSEVHVYIIVHSSFLDLARESFSKLDPLSRRDMRLYLAGVDEAGLVVVSRRD